jgi:hypothetical protein
MSLNVNNNSSADANKPPNGSLKSGISQPRFEALVQRLPAGNSEDRQ